MELESIADLVSSKKDLIAINGNDNPQQLYLVHRKGWTCSDSLITDLSFINNIQKKVVVIFFWISTVVTNQ